MKYVIKRIAQKVNCIELIPLSEKSIWMKCSKETKNISKILGNNKLIEVNVKYKNNIAYARIINDRNIA